MAKTNSNGANLGFENQVWAAADKLRGHMDATEYKNVVLGLIFLKYISDAFQAKYKELDAKKETEYTDTEDRDEYSASNIFWVPKEARWANLPSGAKQPTIGKLIDDAMVAIEKENPTLKGVLPKDYGRPSLDKHRLDELVEAVCRSVTIDWTVRENARAQIRVIVKRILRKYGYPPDKQEKATQTVLEQAEVLCQEWSVL
jgi:type I restriction enzyme M protein